MNYVSRLIHDALQDIGPTYQAEKARKLAGLEKLDALAWAALHLDDQHFSAFIAMLEKEVPSVGELDVSSWRVVLRILSRV